MRRRGRVTIWGAGLAAIAAVVLLASGCGGGGVIAAGAQVDLQNGQELFSSTCGGCHALQAAGTGGTVGPNLDNSFAGSRLGGYSESSIKNIVLDQIRLGSGPIATYTEPEHGVEGLTDQQPMPANLVTGQDAIDVAAYVASAAGTNGFVQPVNLASLTSGASIFKQGPCGSCHTLKAAGTTGKKLDLDKLAGQLTLPIVLHQVTNGSANMPAFKGTLTDAQIRAVSSYVVSAAGK